MDDQDWTPVVVKRRVNKKEAIQKGYVAPQARDNEKNERIRLAKLENADGPISKKRVNTESIQELIKKRIEMKLSQDKADALCSFPKHTFREMEANRLVPNEQQKSRIQHHLSVRLKIDTVIVNNS